MAYKDKEKQRKYLAEHYQKNKDRYRLSRKVNRPSYVERNIEYVENYKKDKPCLDCGGVFPSCAMDFDHREPKQRLGDAIAQLVQKCASLDRIKQEIEKCDLICANCHRVRTANRKYK